MDHQKLNHYTEVLLKAFDEGGKKKNGISGIRVSPIVSELASWYERLRNAMEYHEDEVILRAAIERILKRRLILGGSGRTVALPLARELIWARYFPEEGISDETIQTVEHTINLYLKLRESIILQHSASETTVNTWIYQLMSSDIEEILNPHRDKEMMINFMFHILKNNILIADDAKNTRDAQVFIAIRRAYAKNDTALLRYHLFLQFFGKLADEKTAHVGNEFKSAHKEIEKQLQHPSRFRIFSYIKKQTPPFLILDDVLSNNRGRAKEILHNHEELKRIVFETCERKYNNISTKVRRAIIKSVIFLFVSKTIFALVIEGTYERLIYGEIMWASIVATIVTPPLLMILVGLFIKAPGRKNTEKIFEHIEILLYNSDPHVGTSINVKQKSKKASILESIFALLWIAAFVLSFGLVVFLLSNFHVNAITQAVFLFFLAIVAFLAYRIYRTAHAYTMVSTQGFLTPLIDFLFLPIAQVGRYLTEGISQINILLFIFDFIIEAPFKSVFGFFEELFSFLHTKREYLE